MYLILHARFVDDDGAVVVPTDTLIDSPAIKVFEPLKETVPIVLEATKSFVRLSLASAITIL